MQLSDVTLKVITDVGAAIISLLIKAFRNNDLETIKRVSDILPDDEPLKSRVILEAKEQEARSRFSD
jgi:hypothetical protein